MFTSYEVVINTGTQVYILVQPAQQTNIKKICLLYKKEQSILRWNLYDQIEMKLKLSDEFENFSYYMKSNDYYFIWIFYL